MQNKFFIGVLSALTLMACTPSSGPQTSGTSNMSATNTDVEIALADKLDGVTNNYCIDIAGGNRNVDISRGLQGHTCYSYKGELGTDQIFDTTKFTDNLLYMPVYDVCASLSSLDSGAKSRIGEV